MIHINQILFHPSPFEVPVNGKNHKEWGKIDLLQRFDHRQ